MALTPLARCLGPDATFSLVTQLLLSPDDVVLDLETWRVRVGIGETLATQREDAGLTVAEVSARTRIRETIIRAIEREDYSLCGGNFYARGYIRSIGRVLGIDPEQLVREY